MPGYKSLPTTQLQYDAGFLDDGDLSLPVSPILVLVTACKADFSISWVTEHILRRGIPCKLNQSTGIAETQHFVFKYVRTGRSSDTSAFRGIRSAYWANACPFVNGHLPSEGEEWALLSTMFKPWHDGLLKMEAVRVTSEPAPEKPKLKRTIKHVVEE